MIKERQAEQMMNVLLNKKGFTLVEVMIALVVMLIVFLALMQTALVGIDSNMINILRDEAVSIAEMRMNEARNQPFDSLVTTLPETVSRNFRNITNFRYTVTRTVTSRGTDNKQIDITIRWEWKEKTVANGNPYTHSISTILRRL
jgi:prepilin-type N-terminal cleavage/methylation domain-containing protein